MCVAHLAVNYPLANLVVLSDNFESMGGFVESVNEPMHFVSIRNTKGFVEEAGWVNLVRPDTWGISHDFPFSESPMMDMEVAKAYQDDLVGHTYIKAFRFLSSREPNDNEVRQHLDF